MNMRLGIKRLSRWRIIALFGMVALAILPLSLCSVSRQENPGADSETRQQSKALGAADEQNSKAASEEAKQGNKAPDAGVEKDTNAPAPTSEQGSKDDQLGQAITGYELGSVVWSPKGNCIAFIGARPEEDTDEYGLTTRDSIWVQSVSEDGLVGKPRRLVMLTRANDHGSVAAILFWLDDSRIGWAIMGRHSYTFMQMGLHDSKPKRLTARNFTGTPCSDCGPWAAPFDAYYDAGSRTVIFSGSLTPIGVYVRTLSLGSGEVRNLSVPHPKGLAYPEGWLDAVCVCGSLKNPSKPVFYISAPVMSEGYGQGGFYLWRSDSYSLKQDKIIASYPHTPLWYPRVSPDGRLLAYQRNRDLMVQDLHAGRQKTIVTNIDTDSVAPNGCRYSWSPDGKRIVYADGREIKIVNVPPLTSAGKD